MKKSSAIFLITALLLPAPAQASATREILARAKATFEAEEEGRGARRSAAEFMKVGAEKAALIAQKNQLAALENSNFSNRPTPPRPVIPPDVPPNPGAGEDELFDLPPDLPPMEEPKKDAIIHGGTLYGALLKHGADIRETDSDFFRAVSDFVQDIFETIASRKLSDKSNELLGEAMEHMAGEHAKFLHLAYQAAVWAQSFASQAVEALSQLPIDSSKGQAFLSEVANHMNVETTTFQMPDGSLAERQPLFMDWYFDTSTLFYAYEEELVTDEQWALDSAARHELDRFNAAVYATQRIYELRGSFNLYYHRDTRDVYEAHKAAVLDELNALKAYLPELYTDEFELNPYLMPDEISYTDEKGNSMTARYGSSQTVSFYFDGTLTQGMQEYVDNASWWQWLILPDLVPSPSGEGYLVLPAIPIEDKYGDFMAPPEPSRSLASNDREIFNEVLAIKTIETGQPTYWEFRDPGNNELLASVEVPGSEALPANMNPIGLNMPVRIKEFYRESKLELVEVHDTSTQASIYIQPTRYSDRVIYDPASGQVFEGVITTNPQALYNGPFSAAMHQGEESDDYFDEYFEYYFSLDDEDDSSGVDGRLLASTKRPSNDVYYHILPGIGGVVPEGAAAESIVQFANGLIAREEISTSQISLVPMFEGNYYGEGLVRDMFLWDDDATKKDESLTEELIGKLAISYSQMSDKEIKETQVVIAYSGSTNLALKAISATPGLPVDTLISWAGPTKGIPTDFSKNPRFNTFINVWGAQDSFKILANAVGGDVGPLDLSVYGVQTINIEILNASHNDFWYSDKKLAKEPDLNRRLINERTSIFLQDLAKAAGEDLDVFLNQFEGFKNSNGVYVIDLDKI